MIRVRFAPSPTGFLHIGGVRTALFNFLYARQQGGQFLLRIEDTDRQRSTPEFEQEILDSLRWLGLDWDGELVHQSRRLDRYREIAQELVSKGLAYQSEGAIKFKIPKTEIKVYDIVRGEVTYDSEEFEDLVIMKSDGFPVFHLAVIVDDHDMEITHVIRGEDHLTNTPRHILLQQALGWKPPKYAHLPLIFGSDGTPLSKRHGAVAVSEYRRQGFLPQALLNYLALLGWNPGTQQEIFSLQELVKQFSLKRVIKSNAQFNPEKLFWLNGQHLRMLPGEVFEKQITEFWHDKMEIQPEEQWRKLIALYRPRIQTFEELQEQSVYCFSDPAYTDEKMLQEIRSNSGLITLLKQWGKAVQELPDFEDTTALDQKTRQIAETAGLKPKDIIHPLRFVLTGRIASPGLFELMSLIGKEICLKRLHLFLGQ
ncbi:MAG TPA: glutamate--tRNA ligase [Candidatus Omnitrophota bacterium]|nr:glutamate--tRNA ligase [Candidatus Omnitrophota bacterium]